MIVGNKGTIEMRKYIDIGGENGTDHLFLIDNNFVRRIDCTYVDLPYGRQLVQDRRLDVLHNNAGGYRGRTTPRSPGGRVVRELANGVGDPAPHGPRRCNVLRGEFVAARSAFLKGLVALAFDADGHGYVLADQSGRYAPTEWGAGSIGLYRPKPGAHSRLSLRKNQSLEPVVSGAARRSCGSQLANGVGDPAPHGPRRCNVLRGELVAARSAFPGLVALAFEHEVGGAPDVDLGYHGNRLHVLDC